MSAKPIDLQRHLPARRAPRVRDRDAVSSSRLSLAMADAKRKRSPKRTLRRVVAIVPVSDYRDVAG
jgi:hypothetical protein